MIAPSHSTVSSDCRFEVDEVFPTGLVTGRNGDVEIPVGAVFTSLRKSKFEGSVAELREMDLGVIAKVSLRLYKVEFFRQFIGAVPPGCSAGLHLSGEGMHLVRQALLERRERECLTLHFE